MKKKRRRGEKSAGHVFPWHKITLWFFGILYILYFSILSIARYKTLYASYYDLGIMHQTVFNTFRAIQTLDFSRFLQMTNTIGPQQITRIAIHNDLLLALLAPFYFIDTTPATILVIQTVVLAAGAWLIYNLTLKVFERAAYNKTVALTFSIAWLFYTPMQRSNLFDFHAVVLSTTFLLGMYYFWLVRRYRLSFMFFILSLISKEQVGLTTALFGIYALLSTIKLGLLHHPVKEFREILKRMKDNKMNYKFGISVFFISIVWFLVSVFIIIPYFRGSNHFAAERYDELGGSPGDILVSVLTNPMAVIAQLHKADPLRYLYFLLGPLGFLSLLSPFRLLIALPELAINLLSNEGNMRNIIYHYTAVIQPFVFIAAIYGFKKISNFKFQISNWKIICFYIICMTLAFSYFKSPLPYSREKEIHPFAYPQKEAKYMRFWSKIVEDENIRVAATGQLAPHFAGRRYFYTFSKYYPEAEYVIIRRNEIYDYSDKDILIPVYEQLVSDRKYVLIQKSDNLEVYRRVEE